MKGLLIAEKPSLMRAIQSVYSGEKGLGYELDFAAFHGHLMELAEPKVYDARYVKWKLEDLPILPNPFIYLPQDKNSVKVLLAKIRAGHYDFLVNACDAGREGELIFCSFYEANRLTTPVKRFWASDTTVPTIKSALKGLLPASDFAALRQAAKYRAQLDWLTGINFSRAITLKTNKTANVGRVISPTLKMIVDRELEIRSFVSEDFFEIRGTFETGGGDNYQGTLMRPPDLKNSRFGDRKEAESTLKAVTAHRTGVVKSVEQKDVTTKAPTLYSLTELQKDASRYFHFQAKKTLDLAQSLYEAGVLSYPRTESRFLPTAMVAEIRDHLKPIEEIPELERYAKAITQADIDAATKGKDYVDNAKITDHHAIIPTTQAPVVGKMSADELKIYTLVAKRFLAIFMEPYIVAKTAIMTDVGGHIFRSTGKVEKNKGFGVLYASKAVDAILPAVKQGDMVDFSDAKVTTGKTVPPPRYTTDTLLDAMVNAGRNVSATDMRKILKESEGIGTPATRADILEKLKSTGMAEIIKNAFVPTEFGMALIAAIGDRAICSPLLTAEWEKKLKAVENGTYKGDFRAEMDAYVSKETADMIGHVKSDMSMYANDAVGACPICGSAVISGKEYFRCVNYKKPPTPCTFISSKTVVGASISNADMKKMLAGEITTEKVLKTKDGRTLKAPLKLVCEDVDTTGDDGKPSKATRYRIAPAYAKTKREEATGSIKDIASVGECPLCHAKVYEDNNFYICVNRSKNCSFSLSKSIKGANITKRDASALLKGKSCEKTFTWKNGKSGKARILLKNGKVTFDFSN